MTLKWCFHGHIQYNTATIYVVCHNVVSIQIKKPQTLVTHKMCVCLLFRHVNTYVLSFCFNK